MKKNKKRAKRAAGRKSPGVRILMVDDHPVVRRGLMDILREAIPSVQFGEAENAESAIALIRNEDWNLLVLDICIPGPSGMVVISECRQVKPDLPILVLSVYPEEQYAIRVLGAGASGYLNKEAAPDRLAEAANRCLKKEKYLSPRMMERLTSDSRVATTFKLPHEKLWPRERQVLFRLAAGKTVSEIAAEFSLSMKTISTHRTRILEKMKMSTTPQLMQYCVEHGLLE